MHSSISFPGNYIVIAGFIFASLSTLFMQQVAGAASTATVGATVTAQNLSLSVSSGTITYGSVALNTSTTTVGSTYTQVVTNTGSTMVLNAKSSDATGGTTWTLDTSNATLDHYIHEVSTTTGSSYMKMPVADTYITASSSFPTGAATQALDFRLTTPNTSSDFVEKSVTITLQASAS